MKKKEEKSIITNIDLIRSMKDEQLADFLLKVSTQQDFYEKVSSIVCGGDMCPLSGQECPMHTKDDSCPYTPSEIMLYWLKSDFRIH